MRRIYRVSFDGAIIDVETIDIPTACAKALEWIKSENPKADVSITDVISVAILSTPIE